MSQTGKNENDRPRPAKWLAAPTLALACLVPGAGFLIHRRFARGLTLFVAVNLTFAIGIAMSGGVTWPVWDTSNEGFNIVNNLTFVIQMGSGGPALFSLILNMQSGVFGIGALEALKAVPSAAIFDLGSFYLLVAGAMNYFVVCSTYDRLFGKPKPQEDEPVANDEGKEEESK